MENDKWLEFLMSDKCKNVIVLTGAGISVAAGIPDFRTPGSGLYSQMAAYNLPHPESMFDLEYFVQNPTAFCTFAKEIWKDEYQPTLAHHFIKMLHDLGKLRRLYTQNIDGLDRLTGLPEDKIVEVHGNFQTAKCALCKQEADITFVKNEIKSGNVARCVNCNGPCKPDIVFFGEAINPQMWTYCHQDFPIADMLIIMGTSLKVHPFADLIFRVPETCPRIVFDRIQHVAKHVAFIEEGGEKYEWHNFMVNQSRDVMILGELQEQIRKVILSLIRMK